MKMPLLLLSLFILLIGSLGVYAINATTDGYRLGSSEIRNITLADSSCKRVTNNGTDRFIPTKSMAEWNSFNSVSTARGVTVGLCTAPCSAGYYRASNNLCISALRGPHPYQTAWNNCLAEQAAMLDNNNIRGVTVSEICTQSGNCGALGTLPNGKMVWNPETLIYNTSTYNNYYMSFCGQDGCMAHGGNFALSGYPSGPVSSWATGSDPADGSHYYFCVKSGCPPNMVNISGQCYSDILGPTTFAAAYNNCVSNYGTTILSDLNINNVSWRSWSAGQVNYAITLPDGTYAGSTSCYPSTFPPTSLDVSCWGGAATINQVFSADHTSEGAPGVYNSTARYRCQKAVS